jgi:AraC-like DNA-binding protein
MEDIPLAIFYEKRPAAYTCFEASNMAFQPHVHQHVELLYVRLGRMQLQADKHQKLLEAGELAVVFPHMVHQSAGGHKNRVQLVIFSPALTHGLVARIGRARPKTPFLARCAVHSDVAYVMDRLLEAADSGPPTGILHSYLTLMLERILERLALEQAPAEDDAGLVARALAHIDDHAAEPLALGQMAEDLGVSKYHLSHCFSQKLGISLHQYINSVRVQRALGLLQEGVPASEAGYAAGFESASTFYRVFHSQVGTSPKAYQQAAPSGG